MTSRGPGQAAEVAPCEPQETQEGQVLVLHLGSVQAGNEQIENSPGKKGPGGAGG